MKKSCKICSIEIEKKVKWSITQFENRVTCSRKCQALLRGVTGLTEEHKNKISKSRKGQKNSKKTRGKISESLKGRKHTKKHIINALKGRKVNHNLLEMTKKEKSEYRYFYNLKKIFGLSRKDYEGMLKEQSNKCRICNLEATKKRLCVDHCHKTGKVRALLCTRCNATLGQVQDNIVHLEDMIKYLNHYENL